MNKLEINIYGDISEDYGYGSQMLLNALEGKEDIEEIHVHINSFGGSVAEGIAIYNILKNHKAKVITYCDSFACSIASVIFMAGDERIMNEASLLMIHNAWTIAVGNAENFRKQADDLDKISELSVGIYAKTTGLDEKFIKEMMDAETWIDSSEAIEYNFATDIVEEKTEEVVQSVKQSLIKKIKQPQIVEKIVEVEKVVEPTALDKFIKIFK